MSNNIPSVLEDLFLKNLAFFKVTNKNIYNLVNSIELKHTKIEISEDGKIDLLYQGSSVYGGDAIAYTEKEVEEFSSIYKDGEIRSTTNIPYPGLYSIPRFFQKHLNETITNLYHSSNNVKPEVLHHNNKFDFLVLTGIGLGLHLSELLDKVEVRNLLIFETDYELLTISLFFTDWEEIYKKQDKKDGKSITIIAVNYEDEDVEYGSLWNELILRAPHFPFNTVFYNHGRHDKYGRYLRKIKEDQKMFMSLWGHYDDEMNQLNHIMYNIERNVKWIPNKDDFKWDKPVVVCGSGPSLDERIDQLKEIKDNVYIISAGTSLSVLLENNITPDFQIEIESDYNVYTTFKEITNIEKLKDIILICGIQSTPYIHSLFKESYSFCKDSLSCSDLLEKIENKLKDSTPTCVNAAVSFALQYSAKDIYLFGTDFGFYSIEHHHSKNSIYNKKTDESKVLREASEKNMRENFIKDGYLGDCLTTDMYFTTKRRIEMSLKYTKNIYKFKVFNCSDGLIIEETKHIRKKDKIIIEHKKSSNNFSKMTRDRKNEISTKKIKYTVNKVFEELTDILIKNLEIMPNNINGISTTTWSISNYISTKFSSDNGTLSYFIRGTIWHYMLTGYSIAFATPKEQQEKVIKYWKYRFIDFLDSIKLDLNKTLSKERSTLKNDKTLEKTITEI